MRQSTYLTMTLVFTIAPAIICDALNNSNRSITFGCIACACSIPAFSCASILFQSGSKSMKKDEETTEDTETVDSEENNNAE